MDEHTSRSVVTAAIAVVKLFEEVLLEEFCNVDEEDCIRQIPVRIKNYVDGVIPSLNDEQFRQHFRITRTTFEVLLPIIDAQLKRSYVGRPPFSTDKQLLSVLWILATPDSYRSVGERFDMSKSSLSECFFRIVEVLKKIAKQFIYWPDGEEMQTVMQKFQAISGIDKVLGAIDGTFVLIKKPVIDGESYRTRKCNYALTLQGICDAELKFRDCFIAYPGSVSDTRIFRNCGFYKKAMQNSRNLFPEPEMFIIGDKAYPLLEFCIPPYIERANFTEERRRFNFILSQTRQVIERAFALLFGRFRRLKFLDMNRVDFIPATILACCVLHNICLAHEDDINQYIIEGNVNVMGNEDIDDIGNYRNVDEVTRLGSVKRDYLCRTLTRN